METVLREASLVIAFLLGGGGVTALLLYMSKSAIAAAVEQAGKREIANLQGELALKLEASKAQFARDIEATRQSFTKDLEVEKARIQAGYAEAMERLKAQFSRELEEDRRRFARDLERERVHAAQQLESFKASLLLAAEVRRQAAAKKVEALLYLVDIGEPLLRTVINARSNHMDDHRDSMQKVYEFIYAVRSRQHFFSKEALKILHEYPPSLMRARAEFDKKSDVEFLNRAIESCNRLIDLVRAELGISSDAT
ncbi:hypothetical protein [Sorangium sp. So ce362]|uniref:hypothetical protein n=1 Tax=Sorangium sp. So ce362 TaxID=3133303 RepID=UPI003F6470B1